uniref:Uncharacterized protein n=1 Tax=Arundo donax TaxID=35708 RepID=A0A0A8XSJ5_ARUDO
MACHRKPKALLFQWLCGERAMRSIMAP